MRLGLSLAIVLLLAASVASAEPAPNPPPPTSPEQRQQVIDLAYVLGEAHALHRACAGTEDNTWRARMSRLLQVETPDPPYRQRLMDSFNAGFTARSAEFTTCTTKAVETEQAVAAKGRSLSRHLASGVLR